MKTSEKPAPCTRFPSVRPLLCTALVALGCVWTPACVGLAPDGLMAPDAATDGSEPGDGAVVSTPGPDATSAEAPCEAVTLYADSDADGWGDPHVTLEACGPEDGFVERAGDCDDACAACYDTALEDCDGVDNDCDGQTDNLDAQVCGSQIGLCEEGERDCVDGAWSECMGGVEPSEEVCGNGQDENCDGSADERCPCTADDASACGMAMGECTPGTQACEDGSLTECQGATMPKPETCDGKDNDCDGSIDEELVRPCGQAVGLCEAGTESCEDGQWGSCTGAVGAVPETCDGKDNDCDGSIDEDVTRACGKSEGECTAGVETCAAGEWQGDCVGQVGPRTEVCDDQGKDEDCDGDNNEGCACADGAKQACGVTDVGPCQLGQQTCSAGQWNPTCVGKVDPASKDACDAARRDDDCDGVPNNGCSCDEGGKRVCGSSTGECKQGVQTCDINGTWSSNCAGERGPQAETCNGLDDDCDGSVDEPGPGVCPGQYCVSGSCKACTPATQVADCGASTACLRKECVSNSCKETSLSSCRGAGGQPGTCNALGECRYCGDGSWTQGAEACDESASGWGNGACSECSVQVYEQCNQYTGDTYCPNNETCFFTVCLRECLTTADCPSMPNADIECRELFAGTGVKQCAANCRTNRPEDCPLSGMICDNATFCAFPSNL